MLDSRDVFLDFGDTSLNLGGMISEFFLRLLGIHSRVFNQLV